MPPRLTPLREHILRTIRLLTLEEGLITGVRLAEKLGKGRSGLQDHLDALEELGLLVKRRPSAGIVALELSETAREALGIGYPVLGGIAAGAPILALGEVERRIETLEDLLPLEYGDFFLTVQGDSMCNSGICDGDLALIRPQRWAEDGDIVVALVEGEGTATLKYYFREDDWVRLEPANPDYQSMTFPLERVIVQGVCIRHISTMKRTLAPA